MFSVHTTEDRQKAWSTSLRGAINSTKLVSGKSDTFYSMIQFLQSVKKDGFHLFIDYHKDSWQIKKGLACINVHTPWLLLLRNNSWTTSFLFYHIKKRYININKKRKVHVILWIHDVLWLKRKSNLPNCQSWECLLYSLGFGLASGYWERSKVRTLLMTQSPCCERQRNNKSTLKTICMAGVY